MVILADATQFWRTKLAIKEQYFNFIAGAVDATSAKDYIFLDYTGGFDLSETFFLGINAAYVTSNDDQTGYQGAALYLQNTFSDTFSLGLRPELFQYNGDANADESVTAITLSANVSLTGNLKLITDLRFDSSDDFIIEAFPAEKNTSTLTIAAVYSF